MTTQSLAIKSFNTGREYTAHGQRIAYAPIEQRGALTLVAFNDVDRMISGKVLVQAVDNASVLAAYDAGAYTSEGYVEQALCDKLAAAVVKAQKPVKKSAAKAAVAQVNRFSVSDWRDGVECAAKDMVTASSRVLALVLAARDNVHEDTVRDALQHAFGEAYADLQGIPFEQALKAKSVKNRISDAMAVFKAEVLPGALPNNLQHAAAECRKANRKAAEPANEQTVDDLDSEGGQDEPGLGLPDTVGPVDAAHHAIKAMLASLNVLRSAAKSHTLTSLLEDMAELIEEVGNELDAEE